MHTLFTSLPFASPMPPKARECPRCWKPLQEERRSVFGPDVTVDLCPQCSGEFLDRGEIRKLTGDRDLHKLLTKHLGIDSDSQLLCPACGGLMDAEHLELESATVEVDVCLSCHGVWLDDGELGKIKESDVDHSDLSSEKVAEIFDAKVASDRQRAANSTLGRILRGLRR